MLTDALPALTVAVPSEVAPSENWMAPVGVPEATVTVAVKVTDCPEFAGLAEETTAVVEVALVPAPNMAG